jgi:hypothetical protein
MRHLFHQFHKHFPLARAEAYEEVPRGGETGGEQSALTLLAFLAQCDADNAFVAGGALP